MPQPQSISNPTLVSEEVSQKELASTVISRGTAQMLVVGFMAALLIPVVVQTQKGKPFDEFRSTVFPPTRESLQALGRAVDEGSAVKQWVQPKLQEWLTQIGGFGNEKVTIGRDGWLYYGPGLKYIFGHPFLDPEYLKAKSKAMIDKSGLAVAHPDPLPAFRQLAEDCKRLDIQLILVPVPDKGMIVPRHLGVSGGSLQNADFDRFRQTLESLGVQVLAVESMIESADAPWYLRQDTHWAPRFMDRVARGIAERLKTKETIGQPPLYRLQPRSASSRGDLVAMLKLSSTQTLFPAETVQIEEVEQIPKLMPEPEILLLGDSFTNIYSSSSLEWGQHAGLGEHVAYHANAPVDVIATNGGGASVRQELIRAARTGRLDSIRTLVYEFAVRDLYLEDWPPTSLGNVTRKLRRSTPEKIESPKPTAKEEKPVPAKAAPADSTELTLTGTLTQISRAIDPNGAPYEDALLYGKIKVDRVDDGSYGKPHAIVVFLAMKNRILLPGANHKVGDTVRMKLIRLKSAPTAVRNMQRSDDTEDFELIPYFVLEELP